MKQFQSIEKLARQSFCVSSFLSSRKPFRTFHRNMVQCRFPLTNRHGPLRRDVSHRQRDDLEYRLIRRENPMIACRLA